MNWETVNRGGGRITRREEKTHSLLGSTTITTRVCCVVKEHKDGSKVKSGDIMRATPRSLKSISHSPIRYFDVYLRNSPWKPITALRNCMRKPREGLLMTDY